MNNDTKIKPYITTPENGTTPASLIFIALIYVPIKFFTNCCDININIMNNNIKSYI